MKKEILLAVCLAGLNFIYGMNGNYETAEQEIIAVVGLGMPQFNMAYMTLLLYSMVPLYIIQMMYGTKIYEHFIVANAYYFSRQENRKRWFVKECINLFISVFRCVCVYLVINLIFIIIENGKIENMSQLVLICLLVILLFSLFVTLFSVVLNLLSIIFGTQTAVIMVYSLQLICTFSLGYMKEELCYKGFEYFLIKFNPIANVVILWHNKTDILNKYLGYLKMKFSFTFSVYYLLLLTLGVIVLGTVLVSKKNIINNKEEQG